MVVFKKEGCCVCVCVCACILGGEEMAKSLFGEERRGGGLPR